jgi:hypothetical protein
MVSTPIIRLEVEGMKHGILVALSEYAAKVDADIQAAVERYCQPENIARVVQAAAERSIDIAIKEEIDRFFRFGDGRRAISAAVEEQLKGHV